MDLTLLLALSPLLILILIISCFKKPLSLASPIVFIFTILIAFIVWQIKTNFLIGSTIKGALIALDISIIIFGALFFLDFLKKTKAIDSISHYLNKISPDKRIQAIILVWFFGSFIEGTAGFGTPAAIVAPLLVLIGFPAITAIVISLIGNSTAVIFGAVGTPIRIGFAGLDTTNVAFYGGLINLIAGSIVPIMILFVVVTSTKKWKWSQITEAIPFSIFAGLCLLVPYFLFTFIGQEFPSLLGPVVGLLIVGFTTKRGFLIPKNKMQVEKIQRVSHPQISRAILPYALLLTFLIIGKFIFQSYPVKILSVIPYMINTFNPGFAFLFSIALCSIIFKMPAGKIKQSAKMSFRSLIVPFSVILFISGLVQIMIYSGNNLSGMESMIHIIASLINTSYLPLISPFIGSLGAFIAGSATISNLLFGSFQSTAAQSLGLPVAIILSLQLVGAGIGNMIALTNIVAVQATVGLKNKELSILKRTFIPFLIYLILVSIIGILLISL